MAMSYTNLRPHLHINLDQNKPVAIWTRDAPELIKQNVLEHMINPTFRGWYCCGLTALQDAIASWKWNQENLGKTFPGSIYVVSEVWIFPVTFEVPQDWLKS